MNQISYSFLLNLIKKIAILFLFFILILSFRTSLVYAGGFYNRHNNHDDLPPSPCDVCNITNTAPVITLLGSNPATTTVGTIYADAGATAFDTEDGDLTSDIITLSTVNTVTVGTYFVTYSVIDSEGLSATSTRTVGIIASSTTGDNSGSGSDGSGGGDSISVVTGGGSSSIGSGSSNGGGGNGPIVGTFGVINNQTASISIPSIPTVLGVSTDNTNSCYYLHDYLRKDFNNNTAEVIKLQIFLISFERFTDLSITGIYDDATIRAVNAFQVKYKEDVLIPWGYDGTKGTSYTYMLTKKKINEIVCNKSFPLTKEEQSEIYAYRTRGLNMKKATDNINRKSSVLNTEQTTLTGLSSTTKDIVSQLTTNAIASSKKLTNMAVASLVWPFGSLFGNTLGVGQYTLGYSFSRLLNLILIIAIIVISYLWHKEYKNNRKIEEVNKEIDLK